MKEDATELILNLKDLAIKVHTSGGVNPGPKTLRIDVKGVGDVTGADIQTPEDVEVVNPEVHIASLSNENSHFAMEIPLEEVLWPVRQLLPLWKHLMRTMS